MRMSEKRISAGLGSCEPDDGVIWTGELSTDGLPLGKGILEFADGTRFSGDVDWYEQTGSGVWSYPGGGRLTGGFTLSAKAPLILYYPGHRKNGETGGSYTRFLKYFGTDPGDPGSPCSMAGCRASFDPGREEMKNRVDALCARLVCRFRREGQELEYNARALLADLITSGELAEDDVLPGEHLPHLVRIDAVIEKYILNE